MTDSGSRELDVRRDGTRSTSSDAPESLEDIGLDLVAQTVAGTSVDQFIAQYEESRA